jgi:hypothetical protein
MRRKIILYALVFLSSFRMAAQTDSAKTLNVFEKIIQQVKNYQIDTLPPPEDKITQKIRELRSLRGGFNINEVIQFKIGEEEQEKKTPPATLDYLKKQFAEGRGRQLLDNATIWIYRQFFDYKELKTLVRFYKTSAGKKLASNYPYILLESLTAAQVIHDGLVKEVQGK